MPSLLICDIAIHRMLPYAHNSANKSTRNDFLATCLLFVLLQLKTCWVNFIERGVGVTLATTIVDHIAMGTEVAEGENALRKHVVVCGRRAASLEDTYVFPMETDVLNTPGQIVVELTTATGTRVCGRTISRRWNIIIILILESSTVVQSHVLR
ncbi:hypothetical protein NPIL_562441 [Nephila pilipes]|uniref:Uncharacterized protein n=1 Tax=Nephila pilipes TaxID=299642 RepID=A0A8X6NJ26_NEPPI|nr:hypothetical protein NPIL_562441 [Nephila pilipes]